MLKRILLLSTLVLPLSCFGQYTNVSATVTDPTGAAYANGTVNVSITGVTTGPLVLTGTNTRVDQLTYATNTDSTGAFTLRLPDNNQITPSGTQWKFNVCAPGAQVNVLGSSVPTLVPFQTCFSASITITGASQSITTTLNAAALAFAPFKVPGMTLGGGGAGCDKNAAAGAATLSAAIASLTTGGSVCANGAYTESVAFGWSDAAGGNVSIICTGQCSWKPSVAGISLINFTGTLPKNILGHWTLDGNGNNAALWTCAPCSNVVIAGNAPGDITFQNMGTNATGCSGVNCLFPISASSANVAHVYVYNFRVLGLQETAIYVDAPSTFGVSDVRWAHGYFQILSTGSGGSTKYAWSTQPGSNAFQFGQFVFDDVYVESASGCWRTANTTTTSFYTKLHCKLTGGGTGLDIISIFGSGNSIFDDWIFEDGGQGAFGSNCHVIGFHDSLGTILTNLTMYFTTNTSGCQPIQALDSWGVILDNFTIRPDVSIADTNPNNNFGFCQTCPAISFSNSNGNNTSAHIQIKNGTIYTPTSYTGSLISINGNAATFANFDGLEVSGIHAIMRGGTFATITTGGAGTANNTRWHDNEINGATTGFSLTTITGTQIFDNQFLSVTTRYSFGVGTNPIVRDFSGMTFAQIPANLGNGSQLYLTDATIANPCAAAGTGAVLKRLNGVNVCN